ncbi:hypothetical protein STCU_03414 [Strigomonas culicis]|uniref:Steroid 5-alpha reductase C-terminal domain-containing protein n=1 Tax=Strigomonas culicis TaxID=28005 RepID=S9V9Y8_9TRYP|nr:hypothetical protein STCU_07449 [Strigomonas culicis]EPY31521.1 hypothetical protein STCU_03414 [Strigomonas culicis]|eukprot:EPY23801.1 hypothetical protein STCU_07449 [Strigomonas culicis]
MDAVPPCPEASSFYLMLAVFVFVFIASHIHDNYSWVDRTWSIVPVVYAWMQASHTLAAATAPVPLLNTVTVFCVLVTAWGLRLTYNFHRRGGYCRGGEDYRWNHVRTWPVLSTHPAVWVLFNLLVISLFQTWLLWAITLPVSSLPATALTGRDAVLALVLAALLLLEMACDNEQQHFQRAKRGPRAAEDPTLRYGFCVTGLFGYSRHLNVFCEGAVWVVLALAAYLQPAAAPLPWHRLAGCVVLEVLTWFSTGLITERLTRAKYPLYAVYQRTTPMLLPALTSTTARTLALLQLREGGARSGKAAEAAPQE